MPTFFTSVKKSSEKSTCFVSRLLGATSKNNETRAICGVDIRDMEFQNVPKTN
jgi:hypothetical protein